MQDIQEDTAMVLALMECNQIDKPELMRLLPSRYEGVVEDLSSHCGLETGRT